MLSKNDELFLTVAKSESISKAAEQLYISQPSLTKRMQQLEAQLGVALFDHKSRPLKLSPAGELYYEYLTRSAVQEHALLLALREAAEGRRGKLSVGAPANFAQSLFPAILPSFCRTFPNVSLSVVEATGAEIQTLIAGRQLDMAFAHIHIADTNVSYIPLSTEKIYLAARRPANLMDADPPLLVQPLAVEDLPPFQYCMYNKNQMIYASSQRFFQHYSIIPDTLIHCGDPVINHTLVVSLENCASFVPSYFIGRIPSDTLRKLIFYAIDVPELSWELRVLYRRDRALGIFAREMIRLVRETPWRPLL